MVAKSQIGIMQSHVITDFWTLIVRMTSQGSQVRNGSSITKLYLAGITNDERTRCQDGRHGYNDREEY